MFESVLCTYFRDESLLYTRLSLGYRWYAVDPLQACCSLMRHTGFNNRLPLHLCWNIKSSTLSVSQHQINSCS